MQKPPFYWSPEHVEIVKEFITKYPKGNSFNVSQVKYSEPDKLKILTDYGRSIGSIYAKGRYILGMDSHQKKSHKAKQVNASPVQPVIRSSRLDPAWNFCPTCGHTI